MSARWIVAASIAGAIIVVLAAWGGRPGPGLVPFEPSGVMVHIPPEDVMTIDVGAPRSSARFERDTRGTWRRTGEPTSRDVVGRIDEGLRLLHGSAPQRTIAADELSPAMLHDFALEPPRLGVTMRTRTGELFAVDFGDLNPQGLAQYARVRGRADVVLLPRYVGDRWQSVIEAVNSR